MVEYIEDSGFEMVGIERIDERIEDRVALAG